MKIINTEAFDADWLARLPPLKRRRGNRKHATYYFKDIVTAFDIETTRLDELDESIMYLWQWQFGNEFCVMGRTWEEFMKLVGKIQGALTDNEKLCVYVHNLSYEFQFLKGIYSFTKEEVFAVEPRKVLKCDIGSIEFRCAYLHSNMSLARYLQSVGVEHEKEKGFDYNKKRYAWTPLSEDEIRYGLNDVLGLVEAVQKELERDNDNLYSIPLTSTGYIRRECKVAMRSVNHNYVQAMLPNFHVYLLCRDAFRGGNTHANRFYSNKIIDNVHSADRSSSYPEVLCNRPFPVGRFFEAGEMEAEELVEIIMTRGKATLAKIYFKNIRLRDEFWGCPYIPVDKCRALQGAVKDNGRILSAELLEITVTDIDLCIILQEYNFDYMKPVDVAYTRYGELPPRFKRVIIHHYKKKTSLKGLEDQEYYYMKSKNKLNATYGMCAQNPAKADILFLDGEFEEDTTSLEEIYEKNGRKAFLPYQWGVWCTAWARWELERGIQLAGHNFIYCDTDSVKYIGEIDWSAYNRDKVTASTKSGAYADDRKGKTHYMGVYEDEGIYKQFKTLGAKKYVYTDDKNRLTVTIAGVEKDKGGGELERHGGIKAFSDGFIFRDAGGLEAVYNDHLDGAQVIMIDGHEVELTSNVCLKPSEYTLGLTAEYQRLLMYSTLNVNVITERKRGKKNGKGN